jgi:hypothetical protein
MPINRGRYIYQNRGTVGGSGSDADTGARAVLVVIEK